MARPEGPPQEPQPRIVRLGEGFHLNLQSVALKARRNKGYPVFFIEPIVIPELALTGELNFYTDGVVNKNHVTPLGPIEFPATISGNAIGFDAVKGGGPLMLKLVLRGSENLNERQMVVTTKHGIYSVQSTTEGPFGRRYGYSVSGGHSWNSQENYPIYLRAQRQLGKQHVTAYFPNDIERLKEPEITIL